MPHDRNGNSSVRSGRHRHIRNFVAIAHAGWRRHTKGMNSRSCGLVQRIGTANSAAPHPDPCGGQAPALHFSVDYEIRIELFGKSCGRGETVPGLFSSLSTRGTL